MKAHGKRAGGEETSMTSQMRRTFLRAALICTALVTLAACERDGSFDGDLRHLGQGIFDTSDAARQATAQRPTPDARGIISYLSLIHISEPTRPY